MSAPRILIVNPLPAALHHYELELGDIIEAGALGPAERLEVPTIEATPHRWARAKTALALLRDRLRPAGRETPILALWPAFGLADVATWWRWRRRVWVVIHDPEPLRAQYGMGRFALRISRRANTRGVGVIVHSAPAEQVLAAAGWVTVRLPHPICRRSPSVTPDRRNLTVVGQWKPARSLEPLEALAALPEWNGLRRVVGRGWPDVAGWSVDSRFVSEDEIVAAIAGSQCVVLPYDRYFQSGIAVRCLEQGVPVVGRSHPFLIELFGSDWPGLVEDGDWRGAVDRARAVAAADLAERRAQYWSRCVSEWARFGSQVVSSEVRPSEAH